MLGLPNLIKGGPNDIGKIIGVQAKNVFIAKLHNRRVPLHRFDVVEFHYAMDNDRRCLRGLIIDNYLLNEQQWIKIISSNEITTSLGGHLDASLPAANVVYKIDVPSESNRMDNLVGIVIEGSNIGSIKFEYASRVRINEGSILEVHFRGVYVLYQVVQASTQNELLESKNEAGIVIGEAVQLGVWDPGTRRFERFGWVPDSSTPIFLADPPEGPAPAEGELAIGQLPGTTLPVIMNLEEAVTHHIAILGVTGCGKSVLARKLVQDISATGTKVLCVDFTGEYSSKLRNAGIVGILEEAERGALFTAVNRLSDELDKWPNQRSKPVVDRSESTLREGFKKAIETFMASENSLAIFELPDVANTTAILEYTKWFFRSLFDIARSHEGLGGRLCVVIEEAHTVIPEWNFIGVDDKRAQAVVNAISQIALQGRKYGVGFIVVAQRTANVSKTVLTQCNSVIAFQQFDKTSSEFLSNYLGSDMVDALPNLVRRQAIAVGRGFKSGVPLIFEVPEMPNV
ncbi:MAG: ATP-binding protein [Candidatus Thorarchaeota archaeon]